MSKSSQKNLFVFSLLFLLVIGGLMLKANTNIRKESPGSTLGTNISSYDGKQVIELIAKAGYSPSSVNASANTDTILRVKTDSTFDCSSALTIPKLGIRKNLPPTATTDIPLGSQAPGTKLAGTCAMGMYNFNLSFN